MTPRKRFSRPPPQVHVCITNCYGASTWDQSVQQAINVTLDAELLHYHAVCNGCVIRFNSTEVMIVPRFMVLGELTEMPQITWDTPNSQKRCMFQIRSGIVDTAQRSMDGTWVEAVALWDFDPNHVLLQLVDYPEKDWWQSYCVLPINSERIKWL